MSAAMVFGVGVGPGDPSLMTFRAAEVLGEVGLLVAPRSSADGESVALAIARKRVPADCRVVEAVFPMSEAREEREAAAREAAAMLAAEVAEGRSAAFVTLGDAMLYSTWGYVLRALRREHPSVAIETVPGVTSMSACAARLGEPLAEGRDALLVWPTAPPEDLGGLIEVAPNVVALKAGRQLGALVDAAGAAGATVSAVRRCGMDGERVESDAAELLGEPVEYFTTAFVRREADGD